MNLSDIPTFKLEAELERRKLLPFKMMPAGDKKFTQDQVRDEMMKICKCKGQYDCDCVSVRNIAMQNLYYRLNSGGEEHPKRNEWY